jgi:hypothetical protein
MQIRSIAPNNQAEGLYKQSSTRGRLCNRFQNKKTLKIKSKAKLIKVQFKS